MAKLRRTDIAITLGCVALLFLGNLVLFAVGQLPVQQESAPDWPATFVIIAGVFMTVAMFSFLYKDNPFFRAAEHMFVGLGLGVSMTVMWYQFMKPHIYDVLIAPAFDPAIEVQRGELFRIFPITLGVLILLRVSRRYSWLSRYPLAMLVGFWAGFSIQPAIHSNILRHVQATIGATPMAWPGWLAVGLAATLFGLTAYFAPKGGRLSLGLKIASTVLVVAYVLARNTNVTQQHVALAQAFASIDRIIIMLGVFSVLCYFFFSLEHTGALGAVSKVGILFLMVAFGASFGYTVMARESLLIGRFQFLLGDWLGLL